MTRNEILEVAGKFYKPETITEREIAFARHMMNYEREACAKVAQSYEPCCDTCPSGVTNAIRARARGQA